MNSNYQERVRLWMLKCFGEAISNDKAERNYRFLEEALELAQACGCDREAAHALVGYVFGRKRGETEQEVGGVVVTLTALCLAHGISVEHAGEKELARVDEKTDAIRERRANKPSFGPLPEPYTRFFTRADIRYGDDSSIQNYYKIKEPGWYAFDGPEGLEICSGPFGMRDQARREYTRWRDK